MVTGIASLATSLKQQQLSLEVGARLFNMAKENAQMQGEALLQLLESTKIDELAVNPHLGANLDVSI